MKIDESVTWDGILHGDISGHPAQFRHYVTNEDGSGLITYIPVEVLGDEIEAALRDGDIPVTITIRREHARGPRCDCSGFRENNPGIYVAPDLKPVAYCPWCGNKLK